jgi:hypothetical protein
MKTVSVARGMGKKFILAFLSFFILAVSAMAGVDSYEVYLNNKLLIRQSMSQPLDLKTLALSDAKRSDKLVIKYLQCNAPNKTGKNRTISVTNAAGKVIKEWKFKDATDDNTAMDIPVGDVIDLRKSATGTLNLCYAADGMQKSQKLAALGSLRKSDG